MQQGWRFRWAALALAALFVAPAWTQGGRTAPQRELIYCAEHMTHEEREAYRARMRAAKSADEKAALREAHQAEMRSRAQRDPAQGPCEPPGRQWHGGRKP